MDKIYIDSKGKNTVVEVPKHGEIKLVIQDGKVMYIDKLDRQKMN